MATSTAQALATIPVYDYLIAPSGAALSGKKVTVTLTYSLSQSASPVTLLGTDPVVTQTDPNGFWQVKLVPNNKVSPSGTLYKVEIEGYRSYLVNVTDVAAPGIGWQSSAIAVLPPVGGGAPGYTLPGGTEVLGNLVVDTEVSAQDYKSLGLPGATAGSRWAGATTAGPPVTGAFLAGDWIISKASGTIWICTLSGSPGTWYPLNGVFNVLDFGAIGNGINNDTAAIQACITAASAYPPNVQGAVVYFPPGCYMVNAPLTVTVKGLTLRGSGTAASVIRPSQAITSYFSISAGTLLIEDLMFQPFATQQAATTLAVALNALSTYVAITVATVPAGGWANGAILRIGPIGGGTSQYATVNQVGGYAAGGVNVVVNIASFTAYYTYGIGSAVQDERYTTSAVAGDAIRLTNNASQIRLHKLLFYYVNGWCVNLVSTGGATAFGLSMRDLYAQHCANGIHLLGGTLTTSVSAVLSEVVMDTMEVGESFFLDGCHDVQTVNLWGGGYNPAIRVRNDVAGIYFANGNFGGLEGYQSPMLVIENPAAGGANAKPRQIAFTDCLFENGTTGVTITDCGTGVRFTTCDFFQNGIEGTLVSGGDFVSFDECNWWQNNQSQAAGKADLNVTTAAARIRVNAPHFESSMCANGINVPAGNHVILVDPLLAGPGALWTTNSPAVIDSNYGGAGGQGKTITTVGATAGLVLNDQGANGPAVQWVSATGGKYLRLSGNTLQFLNQAYAAVIASIDDTGQMVLASNLTLTAGALFFGAGSSQVVPGATGFAVRNNANGADNLSISDAGVATFRGGFKIDAAGHLISTAAGTPATSNLGANVTSVTFTGNDTRGTIAIVMSAGLAANTRVCTATFATSYGATPPKITLVDQTSTAGLAIVNSYVLAQSTGVSFDMAFDQALVAGTYTIDYIVIG